MVALRFWKSILGPYFIKLRTSDGILGPQKTGRLILGGKEGSADKLQKGIEEFNQLSDDLSYEEMFEESVKIFRKHGLVRIDF